MLVKRAWLGAIYQEFWTFAHPIPSPLHTGIKMTPRIPWPSGFSRGVKVDFGRDIEYLFEKYRHYGCLTYGRSQWLA
jgi:hypothetical protein